MSEGSSRAEEEQEAVQDLGDLLLHAHPPCTPITAVWTEALTLHSVRYEHKILREDGSCAGEL